jgi:predicted nucleotidyltransferase component of viral defense system
MGILIEEDPSCYASETQRQVLGMLSQVSNLAEKFFLTGGTALSVFYLHHRSSEDFDFFSAEFRDLKSIDESLRRLFGEGLTLIQSSRDYYSYLIRGVKLDLVFDPVSPTEQRATIELSEGKEIIVDTLKNIASNKLSAVVSRFEAKDIVDLFFISQLVWKDRKEQSFLQCYQDAKKKEALLDDPAMAAYQMEELLTRVLSEREKALPPMRIDLDWESFERDLRFYVDLVYRMHEW